MTLIVANLTGRGIWLTSDMRITNRSVAKAPGFLGAALKLIVLDPTLCIGYAGSVGAALTAIRHCDSEQMNPAAAAEYLLSVHLDDPTVEFVVASLQRSTLVEIKNGCSEGRETAWLGDIEAFNRYQALYHGEHLLPPSAGLDPEYKADLDVAVKMNDAMQDLVLAKSEADGPGEADSLVGEASVTVGPRAEDGLFKYHLYNSYSGPVAFAPASSGPLISTGRGSFTISFLAPDEPGIGAIGLYFLEGQLGILYAPLITERADQPDRFSAGTVVEFANEVKTRYGISLVWVD